MSACSEHYVDRVAWPTGFTCAECGHPVASRGSPEPVRLVCIECLTRDVPLPLEPYRYGQRQQRQSPHPAG